MALIMSEPEKPAGYNALRIPPDAQNGGFEVVRAAIIDGGLRLSLRRAFDEPDAWGFLLADLAHHVARIYAAETALREDDVLQRLRTIFETELDAPTDLGTTNAIS
jgi:hypothetical protein